jgi:hypothetical protein
MWIAFLCSSRISIICHLLGSSMNSHVNSPPKLEKGQRLTHVTLSYLIASSHRIASSRSQSFANIQTERDTASVLSCCTTSHDAATTLRLNRPRNPQLWPLCGLQNLQTLPKTWQMSRTQVSQTLVFLPLNRRQVFPWDVPSSKETSLSLPRLINPLLLLRPSKSAIRMTPSR